jgi:hypothetical protein
MKIQTISSALGLPLALMTTALYLSPPVYAEPLQVQQQAGISFVTGGVGLGEREALTQQASQFNLKVVNTNPTGAYTADVQVSIVDSSGHEVLNTRLDGPWLMAKLPAGRYTLNANNGSRTQTRKLNIGASGMDRVQLSWNEPAGTAQGNIGSRAR